MLSSLLTDGPSLALLLGSVALPFFLFSFFFSFYGVLTGDRRKEKRCANEEKNPPPIFGVGAKHRPLFFSIAKLF